MILEYQARIKKLLSQRMKAVEQILKQNQQHVFLKQKLSSVSSSLAESFSEQQKQKNKDCAELRNQMTKIFYSEMYFQGWRDALELLEFLNVLSKK